MVANAGCLDTEGLTKIVIDMVEKKGLHLKVAWIDGDAVLPAVQRSLRNGTSKFKNIYTGEILSDWTFEPIYAQCYLGGLGIAAALGEGADIVVCGRVSDASPIIGSALWFHGWSRYDLDKLANAFVAGHLNECSNYVCGGNFTGFKALENSASGWVDIGYPIVEIDKDANVVVTKQKNTGGAVTVDTCSSQLLYEIQGPWYFNSDVTAILDGIYFEQLSTDRVAVRGVKSGPPPPTTKVGITARGGYQAEVTYYLTGLDIPSKARMLEAQLRKGLAPYSKNFTCLNFTVIGTPGVDADNQNSATVPFRIFAQARKENQLAPGKFLRPCIDNIMQGYPGATFHLDFRLGMPKPFFEYYVTLLPQTDVHHKVKLWDGSSFEVDPPKSSITKVWPERQPSESQTAAPAAGDFGRTVRGPLGWVAHARSGDKGSDANCGFWVKRDDEFSWLRRLLSTDKIKELLGKEYRPGQMRIDRFELPNLRGVHFLLGNILDRGVSSTSTVDFLGKNVAEFLRSRHVDIPVKFLDRGKL